MNFQFGEADVTEVTFSINTQIVGDGEPDGLLPVLHEVLIDYGRDCSTFAHARTVTCGGGGEKTFEHIISGRQGIMDNRGIPRLKCGSHGIAIKLNLYNYRLAPSLHDDMCAKYAMIA